MSGPQDIPCVYCVFYITFVPLALLSFGKLYNIENLLYCIIALVHFFIKINSLFGQWGIELW